MPAHTQKLLVTTALEESWGGRESILFLGEWCKRYERRNVWALRNYETLQFHWDDREKLKQDYEYLATLHQSLLESLALALNEAHGVFYSLRYWQILLDPWLMAYLGVMFDRWECVRLAFKEHDNYAAIFLGDCEMLPPPFSYDEFVQFAAHSDIWNQCVYQRIIRSQYLSRCSISLNKSSVKGVTTGASSGATWQDIIKRNYIKLSEFLGNSGSNHIVFVGASFNRYALKKVISALGLVSQRQDILSSFRLIFNAFDIGDQCLNLPKRMGIHIDLRGGSEFEEFIKKEIVNDLPRCLVEDYSVLQDRVRKISIRPKVIVTGSSHWTDAFAKMWFAELLIYGTKVVILEHGGSLPPFKELFDFESDISDVRVSWFLPYHAKHFRLPPPKIVGRDKSIYSRVSEVIARRKYCSLIGNECPRWVFRAHFYPMAGQWSTSFDMGLAMYGRLDENIKYYFRVKPSPSLGWNTKQRYADSIGCDKIINNKSLVQVYAMSRVIVCSYPETTFSEAMASGVPTILLYPEHLYELNPIALLLLEILKAAKIVFHDPLVAAAHLNAVWANPKQWWLSSATVFAREEFYRQALDIGPDWLMKWVNFLEEVVAGCSSPSGVAVGGTCQ